MTRIQKYVTDRLDIENVDIFKTMDNTCPFSQCEYESPSDFDCLECWTKEVKTESWVDNERI